MRLRTLATMLATMGLVAGCGISSGTSTDSSSGPINIGFLYPFQGDNAIFGKWATNGIDLRLSQAHYTVAGREIRLFTANEDPTNPSATLLALKTLVEKDGVSIVMGPVFSSDEEAVAAYLQQANVTSIIEETCPWDVAKYKRFICWPGTDVATTRALGDYAHNVLGYKRIATIGPDYVAGHNYIGGAADEFKRLGGTITQQQWVPLTATDMGPYLSKVDTSADALLMWLLPSNEVAFLQQYHSQGLHIPILLEFDLSDPYMQQLGAGMMGTVGLNFYEPSIQNPVNQQFVTAFTKAYPKLGQPSQAQEGNWTQMDAVLRVLTATHGDANYQKFWPAFIKMRWQTPEGPACVSSSGMVLTAQYITQASVSGGTYYWKPIKGYQYQSDPNDTGKCAGS